MAERSPDEKKTSNLSLVLGYLAIKDLDTIEKQVSVLARLGYENPEIAMICNITSDSVKAHKYESKKKSIKQPKSKAKLKALD